MQKLSKREMKLYSSRTPNEYIDNSLKVSLKPAEKARITRLWLQKTKYSIEDIQHARNIHPYWKKKKMEGSYERNETRKIHHDYTKYGVVEWNEDSVKEFIDLNKKDKNGRYIHKDHELAKHFHSTIPGIQHYRRKYNMAVKLLEKEKKSITTKRIVDLITQSEQILRRMLKKGRK